MTLLTDSRSIHELLAAWRDAARRQADAISAAERHQLEREIERLRAAYQARIAR